MKMHTKLKLVSKFLHVNELFKNAKGILMSRASTMNIKIK